MADGLLGGILRDDEEPAAKTPEAFAAALAGHAAIRNPEVARQLTALLGTQAQPLVIQAERLKHQHRVRLECLCNKLCKSAAGTTDSLIFYGAPGLEFLIENCEPSTQSLP